MILIDSDHLSVLVDDRDSRHRELAQRISAVNEPVAVPIVCIEEFLRGWLAQIHRSRDMHKQVAAYGRLGKFLIFIREWNFILWSERAAELFAELRRSRVRIGTQDLRIASIALSEGRFCCRPTCAILKKCRI